MVIVRLFCAVMFLNFLSGCTAINNQPPEKALIGLWQFEDQALGKLTIAFKSDSTFAVDFDNNGKADITGDYSFFIGRLKFRDHNPWVETDCHEAGLYDYEVIENRIFFVRYADQCRPRKHILNYPFVRAAGENK